MIILKTKKIYRPPLVLFYYGDVTLLSDKQKLLLVGSRHYNDYGKAVTEKLLAKCQKTPF